MMDSPPPVVVVVAPSELGAKSQLQNRLPSSKIISASKTKMQGIYAVTFDSGKVGYTDVDGKFLILGLILDLDTGRELTHQLDGINTSDAIASD